MSVVWPTVNIGAIGVSGLLMGLIVLFARGHILSRRTANQEQAALIAGHAAKDEAHAELVAFKNEQIVEYREREQRKDEIIERQHEQIVLLLEEIVPTLQRWAAATEIVALDSEGGEQHGSMDSTPSPA